MIRSNFAAAGDELGDEIERVFRKAVIDTAKRTAIFGEGFLKKKARDEGIFDTGKFARSFVSDVKITNDTVSVIIDNTAKQAETIEFGRDPGKFPPLDELVGWVARNFGFGNKTASYDSLKAKAKSGDKDAREHVQAVFLVGRKIARKGIEAKRFFSKNEAAIETIWLRELSREFL